MDGRAISTRAGFLDGATPFGISIEGSELKHSDTSLSSDIFGVLNLDAKLQMKVPRFGTVKPHAESFLTNQSSNGHQQETFIANIAASQAANQDNK